MALLLANALAIAAPDSLSVPVGGAGIQSPTGIWWPRESLLSVKSTKVQKSQNAKKAKNEQTK